MMPVLERAASGQASTVAPTPDARARDDMPWSDNNTDRSIPQRVDELAESWGECGPRALAKIMSDIASGLATGEGVDEVVRWHIWDAFAVFAGLAQRLDDDQRAILALDLRRQAEEAPGRYMDRESVDASVCRTLARMWRRGDRDAVLAELRERSEVWRRQIGDEMAKHILQSEEFRGAAGLQSRYDLSAC